VRVICSSRYAHVRVPFSVEIGRVGGFARLCVFAGFLVFSG